MERANNMQEKIDNISREMEIIKESKSNKCIDQKVQQKLRLALMGSLTGWPYPRKDSVSLKIGQ